MQERGREKEREERRKKERDRQRERERKREKEIHSGPKKKPRNCFPFISFEHSYYANF